jgi:hypothetical protein
LFVGELISNLNFSKLNKGIPTDDRFVDDYINEQTKRNTLLVEWLEDFRARFGDFEEAQATITEVEAALALYQKVVMGSKLKQEMRKAVIARKADGSILGEFSVNILLKHF